MAFSFRLAGEMDVDSLREFSERLFRTTYGAQNTPENMAMYCQEAFSVKNFAEDFNRDDVRYLLATEQGQIAAYAKLVLGKGWGTLVPQIGVELARFYLDVPFQGRGLATTFMAYCQQWLRQQGFSMLWLGVWPQNVRALRFYQKEGFEKVSTGRFLLGTDPQVDDIMQKVS
ncbi:GNAT family N-acetyltransferase [Salmonirosea aquatica]|uniref:GNAT family N-acetyltransferase n=1 Tax=Salmonirosea aquatica TaxID=2654236 RepID=A0A7C9FYC5_9BACT|nr:GNAT family N-acetyltransferase [Cytophagaceae bacterium SJW1-29]